MGIEVDNTEIRLTYSTGIGGPVERVSVSGPYDKPFLLNHGVPSQQPQGSFVITEYDDTKTHRVFSFNHEQLKADNYYLIEGARSAVLCKWDGVAIQVDQAKGTVNSELMYNPATQGKIAD